MEVSAAAKVEHLMIHLPDDMRELQKIIRTLFKEAAQWDTPAANTIYNLYVAKRSLPDSEKKVERKAVEGVSPIAVLTKTQMDKYKGRFSRVFIDHPSLDPVGVAIYAELKAYGYESFTFDQLVFRVNKRMKLRVFHRKELKPFVYALLDDMKYSRSMSYNHKIKKPEIVFSAGII